MSAQTDLLGWLQSKLADAELSLRARMQSEKTWRSGTDESWAAAGNGNPPSKEQRIKIAETQKRIAVKCAREVAMFKEVIAIITERNAPPA